MKTTISAPKFVDETHVQVTKDFAKKAMIFGTPEYKRWREIKADCPAAVMVTKEIKKNPNKKTSAKNMTYENMAAYIREQDDAKALMIEFQRQISMSKVQTNPYRCVLAWFMQTFQNYDSYKAFFENEAQKEAKERSMFRMVKSSAQIREADTSEEKLALAANI